MKVLTAAMILALAAVTAAHAQMPAPANVIATETAPGQITVHWSPVPGAQSYNVLRSVWPGGFGRFSLQYKDTILVDRDVKSGVQHVYSVTPLNAGGQAGRSARSNTLIPGGNPRAVVTPARRPAGRVAISGKVPDAVEDRFDVAEYDTLLTPAPDTISAARCAALAQQKTQQRRNPINPRAEIRDTSPEPRPESQPLTDDQRTYNEGKCRYPSSPGYPAVWEATVKKSDLTRDEQLHWWREINVVGLAYKHLLQREPTKEEVRRGVTELSMGKHWKVFWKEIAQSNERDQRFGYWAPAPLPSREVAKQVFGLNFVPTPEMCFGGLGPGCDGTLPVSWLEPHWFGHFRLPDGTEMAYVSLGVAVGSILHDNACLRNHEVGLNCNGLGAGDLVKMTNWPAALEWNKASWNVLDGRTWRDVWGPYPTDKGQQALFFDDLRPVPARPSKMALFYNMFTVPLATEPYKGEETKRSHAIYAPKGTWLDEPDAAYCASHTFWETSAPIAKSPMGKCK